MPSAERRPLEWRAAISLLPALLLAGCAAAPPAANDEPAPPVTPLHRATTELPPADVLDVNIRVFTAEVPKDSDYPELEAVYADIRQAEARYMPYQLRRVLEASGQWGDVRVVPEAMPSSELEIAGRIIEANGETLKLDITAIDAAGRVWLDRDYEATAHPADYADPRAAPETPFLDLYHRIANDLVRQRARLAAADKQAIQQIAELKFAALLAPEHYASYLDDSGPVIRVDRLPAVDDPLRGEIALAAERDARLIDVLDQYYRDFYQQMQPAYAQYRAESYREMQDLREIRRQAQSRKALGILAIIGGLIGAASSDSNTGQVASTAAIIGGAYALSSGIDKGRQQNIHVESLREMARSLSAEVEPQTLALHDRTVRLSGSAEEQYREWRELLARIAEHDGPPGAETASAAPHDEPQG